MPGGVDSPRNIPRSLEGDMIARILNASVRSPQLPVVLARVDVGII